MPNPAILAATRQIAASVAQHQKAADALVAAEAARHRVVERIAALDASRADIIARRQRGEVLPDDGPSLALIGADREALAAMLPDADGVVNAARAPVQVAGNALAAAQQGLQQTEDEAAELALTAHAAKLDALLLDTVTHLGAVHGRLGRQRSTWCPSRPLSDALRRLQLVNGEI